MHSAPSRPRPARALGWAAPNNHYHHGDLRNALLAAAEQALAQMGHAQFSLSELARGLGVSPAAVYKHFADKAAVLAALSNFGFEQLTQAFETAAPVNQAVISLPAARLRLERIGQAYFDFGTHRPALFQLMFGEAAAPHRRGALSGDGDGEAQRKGPSPSFAYLARAIEDLQRLSGTPSKPQKPQMADLWLAWSAIHGATQLAIAQLDAGLRPSQPSKRIAAWILAALKAGASAS